MTLEASSPVASLPTVAMRLRAEMTRLLYRSAGAGLVLQYLMISVVVFGSWRQFSHAVVVVWAVAISAVTIARLVLQILFKRINPAVVEMEPWRRAFMVGVVLTAFLWGVAMWVFFNTTELLPRFYMIVIVCGMNAGAVRSLASVPAATVVYVVLTMTPLVGRYAQIHEAGNMVMVFLTLAFGGYLASLAYKGRRDFEQIYRLAFENEELVQTLSEAKSKAEAASQAKSGFLATMSHEIRTPMNGVLGMLQVVRGSTLTGEQRGQLDVAYNSADALMRLLNDILDFSKIESGKLDYEQIRFSPGTCVREVVALMRPGALEKKLQIWLVLAPELPGWVEGDPVRLKQVLLNLVGNAIKFTEQGRVEVSVNLASVGPTRAKLRFTVSDTGIGIEPEVRARLFQVFSQADSSMTRRFGGSGLGLAISQRLVKGMGGEIHVESTSGRGSVFSFELELLLASAPPQVTHSPFGDTITPLQGRVLIVEDDRVNQMVIKLMISKMGLISEIVADGAAAVARALQENWDLVLMDVQMPGIDGLEATRRIRAQPNGKHLPIIALTANAMPEDRAACAAAGMNSFLPKPVKEAELREAVEQWIRVRDPLRAG